MFRALGQAAQTQRLVVVLDEFPYLVAAHPPLASILQRVWDQALKDSQVMLILCGSYIGMMQATVLGYQAPLYGRRTAQYLLEPLQFQDARRFFPAYSLEDQVRAYAVYGGTPAYLHTLQPGAPLAQNIQDGILTRGSFLYDEVRFVLQQELREPRNYFAILEAIAAGKTRLNEIKQATGIEGATAYLDTLQQLRLVERRVPVTETQPHKSRRGFTACQISISVFGFATFTPTARSSNGAGRSSSCRMPCCPSSICSPAWRLKKSAGSFSGLRACRAGCPSRRSILATGGTPTRRLT